MKTNTFKNAALGALFIASANFAFADTTVYFAASNGDRNATQTAIGKLLTNWTYRGINGSTSGTGGQGQVVPSTATGSNFGTWRGTYNGEILTIKTNYQGALAGIAAVAGNTKQRFDISDGTGSGAVTNPLDGTVENTDYLLHEVDFGFSTNFQSTSPFLGVYKGVNYAPISQETVGVSPLGFYASPGFPADNITTQQAQLLYTSGALPLALFTGNWTTHQNIIVYAIGRNTDAGQRFGAYTEIGLGTTQAVTVWDPRTVTVSGNVVGGITGATTSGGITFGGQVLSHKRWPAETISGVASAEGNGGFSTGASLAPALTVTQPFAEDAYKGAFVDPDDETNTKQYLYPNATGAFYIGYLTPGDATTRVLGLDASGNNTLTEAQRPAATRGVALKYNGVALTNDNVRNGQYTAWLYNRFLRPLTGWNPTTNKGHAFGNALRDQIANIDAPAGGGLFHDAAFKVRRTADGGLVRAR